MAAESGAVVVAEFDVVESGRKDDRPELAKALVEARKRKVAITVAKLDRLARDAEFVLRLSREAETNGLAGFICCDLPDVDVTTSAGRLILSVMASVSEFESHCIYERTRDAMAAAKARRVKLGGLRPQEPSVTTQRPRRGPPGRLRSFEESGVLRPMALAGLTRGDMAAALEGAVKNAKAGNQLSPTQVKRLLERLGNGVGEG